MVITDRFWWCKVLGLISRVCKFGVCSIFIDFSPYFWPLLFTPCFWIPQIWSQCLLSLHAFYFSSTLSISMPRVELLFWRSKSQILVLSEITQFHTCTWSISWREGMLTLVCLPRAIWSLPASATKGASTEHWEHEPQRWSQTSKEWLWWVWFLLWLGAIDIDGMLMWAIIRMKAENCLIENAE
jgi:hypothetical protein